MGGTTRDAGDGSPLVAGPFVPALAGPSSPDHGSALVDLIAELTADARVSPRFHLLIIFSCVIATLGLIADSTAVVIGAMLVAPLLTPIMALALGSVRGEGNLLSTAALAIAEGVAVAIFLSWFLAAGARLLPFDALTTLPAEVHARTHPNPFDLGIALAGGAVAAYVLVRMPGADALPGVAIATALMPPLCTVGIGLALGDRGVWGGAALLFLTNLSAIVFGGIVVFSALGFRPASWRAGTLPSVLALALLLVVGGSLVSLTMRAVSDSRDGQRIHQAVLRAVEVQRPGSQLISLESSKREGSLELRVTLRTNGEPSIEEVENIQAAIAQDLQRTVSLVFISVPALVLDPLNPPAPRVTITPVPPATPTPRGKVSYLPHQVALPALARDQ